MPAPRSSGRGLRGDQIRENFEVWREKRFAFPGFGKIITVGNELVLVHRSRPAPCLSNPIRILLPLAS